MARYAAKPGTKQGLLLKAFTDGRTVTHMTALVDMKIPNLTAVIGDLRSRGHRIKAVRKTDVSGSAFTTWVYVGQPAKRVV